jgi:hypothetical protein
MRHLRPLTALFAMAAITVACSASPGASSGGNGQPSTGSQPSQAAASSGGGGGGGGSGANGSITYKITGGYEASGELPFQPRSSVFDASTGGWSAAFADTSGSGSIITLGTSTAGQVISFGDGTASVVGVGDSSSGSGCTFTISKNDSSGLSGHVECSSALLTKGSGMGQAKITAEWDAHP